jgi:trigger factor
MDVNVEKISSVKRKLVFQIPADRVSSEIEKVYGEIRKHAAVKGFRKGKVPQPLVEKYYEDRMQQDVMRNLVSETFYSALSTHEINPVSQPVIEGDNIRKGESFRYSATVEVLPEVNVTNYEGLDVKKEKLVENDEVVTGRLKQMQESMGQLKPIEEERAAVIGDFVTLDFAGSIGETPIDGGAAQDYQLELGSGSFIPGFEEQIVGLKVGDQKKITVSFPETYGNKELAGKEATFDISIKEVKVKELPSLDDEFAGHFGEESLDKLKEKIAEMNRTQEADRIEGELRERIVKALIEKNPLEVPDSMVDKQLEYMLDRAKNRLQMQRMSLEMIGFDEERFRTVYRGEAETQVKGMLLLDSLATKQGCTVEDEEIDRRIEEMAEKAGQKPDVMKKFYRQDPSARQTLAAQLREDKAIEFLRGVAKIEEVEREKL